MLRAVTAVVQLTTIALSDAQVLKPPRSRVVKQDGFWVFDTRYNFAAETKNMTEIEFQRMFRLPRAAFQEILGGRHLNRSGADQSFSSGHPT